MCEDISSVFNNKMTPSSGTIKKIFVAGSSVSYVDGDISVATYILEGHDLSSGIDYTTITDVFLGLRQSLVKNSRALPTGHEFLLILHKREPRGNK
jgi:hypothetical protein